MPGAARRMYPARTSSRWLGTSASAGSSLSVRTNRLDIRKIMGARLTVADPALHPHCQRGCAAFHADLSSGSWRGSRTSTSAAAGRCPVTLAILRFAG